MSGGLISILQNIINVSPTDSDIDIIIAKYLLNNLYLKDLTINKIATECHISKASVTRFTHNLGFDGFSGFKKSYMETFIEREEMKIDLKASQTDSYTNPQAFKKDLEKVTEDLGDFIQKISLEKLDGICNQIHSAKRVHIYATFIPGTMAEILQHMLLTNGKLVEYYPQLSNQLIASRSLDKNDLAIFISLEGSYVMQKDLTLAITSSKATSLLITQNPEMKMASLFDEIVQLGNHDKEQSGKYKLLMFIEILMHRYYKLYE
ncbi:MurR/RpiR family transcriptional regulator [Lacticigenium naphthae]|uniref:MurR/RpiR family transcriptional regulator n=1 Tax=Lacticigenium naphthae TaxID=515351 RepID=UPI00040FFD83|nr:MurR/RpiR family transcriptional regulator [Lacticigenium naphthae]